MTHADDLESVVEDLGIELLKPNVEVIIRQIGRRMDGRL